MSVEGDVLVAVALMALATYATRAGGLWLAGRLNLSERAESFLEQVPGAILVALVAPVVVTGGPAVWGAALAVVVVARRSGSLPLAMLGGVGVVLLLRSVGFA